MNILNHMDACRNPDFDQRLAELRKEIAIGTEEARQGKVIDGEAVFAELRKRSAQMKRAKK